MISRIWIACVLLSSFSSAQHLGFDRNHYPGDGAMPRLRQTFAYTGYWLNNPPGETTNSWAGKRQVIESLGYGFLVIYNGRTYQQIKSGDPRSLGQQDAKEAVAAAMREGFPLKTVIFLDQEEGGRLLPEQREYLLAWVDELAASPFRAGVYCSGIPVKEKGGGTITTAADIHQQAGSRAIVYWVTNDACPPSPGCSVSKRPAPPAASGFSHADVWQFVQSPQRPFGKACRNYAADKNCYPPTFDPTSKLHVDLNTATSEDPSGGRVQLRK